MKDILIKVEGISSLTDARYCAGMGVKKLGVIFDFNGKSSIELNVFLAVKGWIEGVDWYGIYNGNDLHLFNQFSVYQFSEWVISPGLANEIDFSNYGGIRFNVLLDGTAELSLSAKKYISGYEIDSNDRILKVEIAELLSNLGPSQNLFLKDISTIGDIIEINKMFPELGFTFRSSEEERPGWMDLTDLQVILEKIEDISDF